jgi:hypothetical protein
MDGSRSTAPPDPWSKSQGTTPATVPGTRIEKMSVFRATMNFSQQILSIISICHVRRNIEKLRASLVAV